MKDERYAASHRITSGSYGMFSRFSIVVEARRGWTCRACVFIA